MTAATAGTGEAERAETQPVLVAVDFSRDSEAALLWACDYAARVGAPVQVLHVIHVPAEAPDYYRGGEDEPPLALEDAAQRMMVSFLARMREAYPLVAGFAELESVLVVGLPASRILEIAERNGARLLVMGSRGRTGLPHLLLGSNAERVVQLSAIPVTIVKASDKPSGDEE